MRNEGQRRAGGSKLGLAGALIAGLLAGSIASAAWATDLLAPNGEAAPVPVPVPPPPPPLAAAPPPQPLCRFVPQPQSDISGQDVIRFRRTWVCFSRGLLADRLPPPPPPPVHPWWRLFW